MSRVTQAVVPRSDLGNDLNDKGVDPGYLGLPKVMAPILMPPTRMSLAIGDDELRGAELTPKCIVEKHLYADLAQRVAPGGTGKTTLSLWEAVHIVLGLDLYGCKVVTPGWVLIVTAEDRRERLIARLRRIMDDMNLDSRQRRAVQQGIAIWDVTGEHAKLVQEEDGNLLPTPLADHIIAAYQGNPPVLVEFDPLVSFGASESRINDNEQALVQAARRVVNGLDCCVRYVHHTGKANAEKKSIDQYAGRGGSALADGSRMTAVLQSWTPRDPGQRPPAQLRLTPESSVMLYARPKLSYAPPNLPLIWIKREGFRFEWAEHLQRSDKEIRAEQAEQILRFLASEIRLERFHTKTSLRSQTTALSMSQHQIRDALDELVIANRLVTQPLPKQYRHGGRKEYLCPADMVPKVTGFDRVPEGGGDERT